MRILMHRIDRLLRRALGVREFYDDPDCLLRVRLASAAHAISLPDCEIPAGAQILELHLWNEHISPLPSAGPDLAWAIQIYRRLMASFRALAYQMQRDLQLADVQAVGGITALFFPGDGTAGETLFRHLGFTVRLHHSPFGCLGESWENFYTWWIMWTFNPASLRYRKLRRLRRTEIWMSAAEFLSRYNAKIIIKQEVQDD